MNMILLNAVVAECLKIVREIIVYVISDFICKSIDCKRKQDHIWHKRKPIISRQLMRGFLLWFDRKVTIRLIVIGFLIFGFIYCMFLATFISFFCLYM